MMKLDEAQAGIKIARRTQRHRNMWVRIETPLPPWAVITACFFTPQKGNTPKRCPFHYRGLECKVGSQETPGVTGKFGLGVQNEAGQRLIELRKVMTNLVSILKSRDITLSTKVHLVKAMVFPVVIYGCESWTIKKAECQRIDAFELWCWRRLLRVPWIARRSNQSILKESPEYSLAGRC